MHYISSELFHFVGRKDPNDHELNYRTLKKILLVKCISHPPHVPEWGIISYTYNPSKSLLDIEEGMLVPQVVCFCDIPVESLAIHLTKYGQFGLSLKRDHLIRYGARPVTYFPLRSDDWRSVYGVSLLKDIEEIYRSFEEHLKKNHTCTEDARSMGEPIPTFELAACAAESIIAKDFLAFIKPFNSELEETHPNNFYMEREWRRLGNVCFELENIGRILVGKGYSERLCSELPEYSHKVEEIG